MYQQYHRKSSRRRSIPCLQIESSCDLQSNPNRKSQHDQKLQYDPDLDQSISVWERNRYLANYNQDTAYTANNRFIPQTHLILSKKHRRQYEKNYRINCQQPNRQRERDNQNIQIANQKRLYWRTHVLPQVTQIYQQMINNKIKQELILKQQQQSIRRQVQMNILAKQIKKQQDLEAKINYKSHNHKHYTVNHKAFTPKLDKKLLNQGSKERTYSNRQVKSQIVQTQDIFENQAELLAYKKLKKTKDVNNAQSCQRIAIQKQKLSVRNSMQTQLSQKQYQSKISKLQGQNQSLRQEVEYLRQALLTKFQLKRSNS